MVDKSGNDNRKNFELLLKSGMDEVAAYQIAYNVSNEEAKLAIKNEHYNYLIQSGISEETAHKVVFEEDNINKDKKI